jgi:hypothetical protein
LQAFLPLWLRPVDYEAEFSEWKNGLTRPGGKAI